MKPILTKIASIVFAPILEDGKFSIGRWLLVTSFLLAVWKWTHDVNIPESHQTVIIVLIGYVLSSKGLNTIKEAISTYKSIKSTTKQ